MQSNHLVYWYSRWPSGNERTKKYAGLAQRLFGRWISKIADRSFWSLMFMLLWWCDSQLRQMLCICHSDSVLCHYTVLLLMLVLCVRQRMFNLILTLVFIAMLFVLICTTEHRLNVCHIIFAVWATHKNVLLVDRKIERRREREAVTVKIFIYAFTAVVVVVLGVVVADE